ncbi:MAG TPA: DUF2130 domain-containing protein [Cytophagaceae bacterium]|nr:DUF2130 domain-containing protein [Cytophagaceae bacterium]
METINKITCPKCGHSFNAEQALAHEVEEKLRTEYNQKFKGLQLKLAQEAEEKELQLKKVLEQEKVLTEEKLKSKVREDFELQLKSYQEDLDKKTKENLDLKNKELELMKKTRQMEEQKAEMEIEMQKKLLEGQKAIEEAAKRKAEEENQFKLKEKDMLVEQLNKQVADMQKRIEQGSTQMQGEVQEIALEELLRAIFPFDMVGEVGKGVKGADVIHLVRDAVGKECGTIIYESKRTKNFSAEWISKLKNDLRGQKADIAVIVTEAMPKDMDRFGQKDGIWICSFAEFKGVAAVLRESLVRISEIKSAQENRGDKMQMLYDFLTGNEFRQHIEAIVEGFTSMKSSLAKERIAMERIWAERDKQLDKVLLNMSSMYGSIKGIAGSAVAEVKLLDLDSSYSDEK